MTRAWPRRTLIASFVAAGLLAPPLLEHGAAMALDAKLARCSSGNGRCGGTTLADFRYSFLFGFAQTESGGVQSAEGQIQGRRFTNSRMVGKQRDYSLAAAQYIFDKSVKDPLGSHFHEETRPGIVESIEALYKLDRRRDLPAKKAYHFRIHSRSHGIKLAGYICHDGNRRRSDIHRAQYL